MDFRYLAKQFNNAPFTRQVMLDMLKDYKRPNDKISELIKKGDLILLKRRLYIPDRNTDLTTPEPYRRSTFSIKGYHARSGTGRSLENKFFTKWNL